MLLTCILYRSPTVCNNLPDSEKSDVSSIDILKRHLKTFPSSLLTYYYDANYAVETFRCVSALYEFVVEFNFVFEL